MRILLLGLLYFLVLEAAASSTDTLRWKITVRDFHTGNVPYHFKAIRNDSTVYVWAYDVNDRLLQEGEFTDTSLRVRANNHTNYRYANDFSNKRTATYAHFKNGKLHGSLRLVDYLGDTTATYEYKDGVLITDEKNKEDQQIFRSVAMAAEFRGGSQGITAFVLQTAKLSNRTKKKYLHGTIKLLVKISYLGVVQEVAVVDGLHHKVDEAIAEAVRKSNSWKPAKSDGTTRTSISVITLTFE
jgi:hypothetical protein